MFEVSIYTDSRPDESISSNGGFQFQSVSAGFTPSDQSAVLSSGLVHVVDPAWIPSHDPLDHPPSCGYRVIGDRFVLARGRSTGDTYTGRPGNQLTESILTSEIADFTPYRPAQLYGAANWSLEKAGTKSIPAWATPLEVDEAFEADELKRALLADPWARRALPVFLTMVEESLGSPPAKKLVLVGDDLATVMKWIALGTLFLETSTAMEVTFAALVKDWLSKNANIVGTDPVFGGMPAIGPGTPYNVFDLVQRQTTPVEPSPSAAQQAAWFIDLDADDALASVSLARAWEPAIGAETATRAAQIVHLQGSGDASEDRTTALQVFAGLTRGAADEDLEMYADELLAAAVAAPVTEEQSAVLAAEAGWGAVRAGIDEQGAQILLRTAQAIAQRPDLIEAWASASLAAVDAPLSVTDPAARRAMDQALVQLLNAAPGSAIAGLLVLARRVSLGAPPSACAPALDRFAEVCARNPELAQNGSDGAYRKETLGATAGVLLRLLSAEDEDALADLAAGRWDWLKRAVRGPMEPWLAAAELGRRPAAERLAALRTGSVGHRSPPAAWKLVLTGVTLPEDAALVGQWITATGALAPSFGAWLAAAMEEGLRLPPLEATGLRPVSRALFKTKPQVEGREAEQLVNDVTWLTSRMISATRAVASPQNRDLLDFAAQLGDKGPLFVPEVGLLLLDATDKRGVQALTRAAGDLAVPAMVTVYRNKFNDETAEWALTTALLFRDEGNREQKQAADDFLTELADSRESRARVDYVLAGLPEEWTPTWQDLVAERKKGRVARNLKRSGKRMFGKDS